MIAVAGILTALLAFAPVTEPPAPSKAQLEHHWQLAHGAAQDHWWLAVAQCETRSNWQDRGAFAGGLGIYQGTWIRFGGREYAPTPDKATMLEQIVIANRIDKFGWQTAGRDAVYLTWAQLQAKKPIYKYAVGHWGWGCIRNTVGNRCGVKRDGTRGTYVPPRKYRLLHCK